MPVEKIVISTDAGQCGCYVVTPSGNGPWPAAIFFGDAGGMRPAMLQMAQQLSDCGYVVLLPDLYYRFGHYEPLVPKEVFAGDVGAILGPLMATTGTARVISDSAYLVAYLDTREDIKGTKIGAVGFCMGGGLALAAASEFPDRFAAVASFHGGNLATDGRFSPHVLAANIGGEVYIASAENDESYPPSMALRVEDALEQAHVKFRTEVYHGAAHGWMVPDFPVFDQAAASRGWIELKALFDRCLNS